MPKMKRQARTRENRTDLLDAETVTTLLGLPEAKGAGVPVTMELHDGSYRKTRISYPPKQAPAGAGPHDGWVLAWATGWPEDWATAEPVLATPVMYVVFGGNDIMGAVHYDCAMVGASGEPVTIQQVVEALDGVLD